LRSCALKRRPVTKTGHKVFAYALPLARRTTSTTIPYARTLRCMPYISPHSSRKPSGDVPYWNTFLIRWSVRTPMKAKLFNEGMGQIGDAMTTYHETRQLCALAATPAAHEVSISILSGLGVLFLSANLLLESEKCF